LIDHFSRNYRLEWVFRICKSLGIDDPCFWLDNVSPNVVDQWIAFEIHCIKKEEKTAKPTDPTDALATLNAIGGKL